MLNAFILGIAIFAAVVGISVATWSILRTRSILRAHQQTDRIEKIAGKLYLVVIDMLVRMSPDKLSPENVQPYEKSARGDQNYVPRFGEALFFRFGVAHDSPYPPRQKRH